ECWGRSRPRLPEGGGDGQAVFRRQHVVVLVYDGVVLPPSAEELGRVVGVRGGHPFGEQLTGGPGTELAVAKGSGIEEQRPQARAGSLGVHPCPELGGGWFVAHPERLDVSAASPDVIIRPDGSGVSTADRSSGFMSEC